MRAAVRISTKVAVDADKQHGFTVDADGGHVAVPQIVDIHRGVAPLGRQGYLRRLRRLRVEEPIEESVASGAAGASRWTSTTIRSPTAGSTWTAN